ncbi:hypothetical protein KAR91_55365 [Candidatus Pacearchaeota archaeon]|nr:hypothetical protein [Candidatus Pacearchaeota archaeon]
MYQITIGGVRRLSDNVDIPEDPKSKNWRKYQKWLEEGNEPLPMDEPEPIEDPRIALIDGISTIPDVKAVLKELFGL